MTTPARPQAGVLARWRELKSEPGEFAAYCGSPGCGKRLGRGWPDPEHPNQEFTWSAEPGYRLHADGYFRHSERYVDHQPRRSRWRRDMLDRGPSRRMSRVASEPVPRLRPMLPSTRVVGKRSTFERDAAAFIVCRGPKCGAHNLVVPHLAVRVLPPLVLLSGRCGSCPRCLAAGRPCDGRGECPGCPGPFGSPDR